MDMFSDDVMVCSLIFMYEFVIWGLGSPIILFFQPHSFESLFVFGLSSCLYRLSFAFSDAFSLLLFAGIGSQRSSCGHTNNGCRFFNAISSPRLQHHCCSSWKCIPWILQISKYSIRTSTNRRSSMGETPMASHRDRCQYRILSRRRGSL